MAYSIMVILIVLKKVLQLTSDIRLLLNFSNCKGKKHIIQQIII